MPPIDGRTDAPFELPQDGGSLDTLRLLSDQEELVLNGPLP